MAPVCGAQRLQQRSAQLSAPNSTSAPIPSVSSSHQLPPHGARVDAHAASAGPLRSACGRDAVLPQRQRRQRRRCRGAAIECTHLAYELIRNAGQRILPFGDQWGMRAGLWAVLKQSCKMGATRHRVTLMTGKNLKAHSCAPPPLHTHKQGHICVLVKHTTTDQKPSRDRSETTTASSAATVSSSSSALPSSTSRGNPAATEHLTSHARMSDGLHQITTPSGVLLNERKFPVVIEEPTWSQICELFLFGARLSLHGFRGPPFCC